MDQWTIRLLGVPRAHCGDQLAHVRSQETWAVLASLILPSVLRGEAPSPLARETLAERFWAESKQELDSRASVRQCLRSLRSAFGNQCLIANRQQVQIAPGWFVSDLEQVFTAYRKALASAAIGERLHWLMQAEQEICGEFLEGWMPDTDEAQLWLILARADIRSRLMPVLMLLAETLKVVGNPTAAFDITRRVLLFQPGHHQARQMAWELAVLTGQRDVMSALEQVRSFREAVVKFPAQGLNAITLKDGRIVQSLFEAELAALPPGLRLALRKLSVFPAPFPIEIAEAVCGASLSVLQALRKTPFLQKTEDTFFLPPLVQDCAWKQLATTTRRQLRKRLAQFCIETILPLTDPEHTLPAPLGPADRGRPLLRLTLEWVLEQDPLPRYVEFIERLRYRGLNDLALLGVSYLQKIETDSSCPAALRSDAGIVAAYVLMHADDNAGAIVSLERGISLLASSSDLSQRMRIYVTMMRAYSNVGQWDIAEQRGRQGLEYARLLGNPQSEVHCIRFLGEIRFYAGDLQEALVLCEEAHDRGRDLPPQWECIPDVLYWKARILHRLQRWEEASDAIEEALSRWLESGDTKVGLCLCILGQLHMELGRYAEARMHLEHAISLHSRFPREGHRIAAIEALGDLCCAVQKNAEAHADYEICLVYYQKKGYLPGIERLQQKLSG